MSCGPRGGAPGEIAATGVCNDRFAGLRVSRSRNGPQRRHPSPAREARERCRSPRQAAAQGPRARRIKRVRTTGHTDSLPAMAHHRHINHERTSWSLPVSLDRLDLRAWPDERVTPAVSRAGRRERVDGGHLDNGRTWRCRSRPCRATGPAAAGGAAGQRNRVDGQGNRSRPRRPWPRVFPVRGPCEFSRIPRCTDA
jgi:hypothetical protein